MISWAEAWTRAGQEVLAAHPAILAAAPYDTDLPLADPGFLDFNYIPWWLWPLGYFIASALCFAIRVFASRNNEAELLDLSGRPAFDIVASLFWPVVLVFFVVCSPWGYLIDYARARATRLHERDDERLRLAAVLRDCGKYALMTDLRAVAGFAEQAKLRRAAQSAAARGAIPKKRKGKPRFSLADLTPEPLPADGPVTNLDKLEL